MIKLQNDLGILGLLVLIIWISSINLLRPLPNVAVEQVKLSHATHAELLKQKLINETNLQNVSSDEALQKYTEEIIDGIWIRWTVQLVFIILGIIVGIIACRGKKYWVSLTVLMSLLFLISFVFSFLRYSDYEFSVLINTYKTLFNGVMLSGTLDNKVSFIHANIMLPIFHLLILYLLMFNKKVKKTKGSSITSTILN